jgi:hypothetical protein
LERRWEAVWERHLEIRCGRRRPWKEPRVGRPPRIVHTALHGVFQRNEAVRRGDGQEGVSSEQSARSRVSQPQSRAENSAGRRILYRPMWERYHQSKLANATFTYALDERLAAAHSNVGPRLWILRTVLKPLLGFKCPVETPLPGEGAAGAPGHRRHQPARHHRAHVRPVAGKQASNPTKLGERPPFVGCHAYTHFALTRSETRVDGRGSPTCRRCSTVMRQTW